MTSSNIQKLKAYLSSMTLTEKEAFAQNCLTTLGNLNQIIYVNKKCSAVLAIRIDKASMGKIPCDDLCPEADFDYLRHQKLSA